MFSTLKNKIKEETGNDVAAVATQKPFPNYSSRSNSINSNHFIENYSKSSSDNNDTIDCKCKSIDAKSIGAELTDLKGNYDLLLHNYDEMMAEKNRIEKTNEILEEALRVAQMQKEIIFNEHEKCEHFQLDEISKLKNLLHFREQEAIDRSERIRQKENELRQLKIENRRLRHIENTIDNLHDELAKLRHSSQTERNSLSTSLAVAEEKNRHLESKLRVKWHTHIWWTEHSELNEWIDRFQIFEEARLNLTSATDNGDKVKRLLREHKLFEQQLEEAHLHLSDIKSTWSAQNIALETQVDRLSRQVIAETADKRRALHVQSELISQIDLISCQLEEAKSHVEERDEKVAHFFETISVQCWFDSLRFIFFSAR